MLHHVLRVVSNLAKGLTGFDTNIWTQVSIALLARVGALTVSVLIQVVGARSAALSVGVFPTVTAALVHSLHRKTTRFRLTAAVGSPTRLDIHRANVG